MNFSLFASLVFNPCFCLYLPAFLGRLYSVMNDLTTGLTASTAVLKSLKDLIINQPDLSVSDLELSLTTARNVPFILGFNVSTCEN
jgi:hypothetical protein